MRVFLSYAASEKEYAANLAKHLSKHGYKVWYADRELLPGDNWAFKVGEALEESDAMIVLVSPDSVNAPWVRREIEFALSSPNYRGRLVSVLVRPTSKIPWILEKMLLIRAGKNPAETSRKIVARLRNAA